MNLFPHVLVRIGGNAFSFLDQTMKHSKLSTALEALDDIEHVINRQKLDLCDKLHQVIGTLASTENQNLVLNVRRNIFNDRNVKNTIIEKTIGLMPPHIGVALADYLHSKEKWLLKKDDVRREYEQTLGEQRKSLQNLLKNDALQKGLVISSRALLKSTDQYSLTDVSCFKKKEFHTELSLLKYITRMCMKTSPFSTFTQLTLAKITSLPNDIIKHGGGIHPEGYTSTIRLNNQIFKYIKELIFSNKEARKYLRLRLNATVMDESEYLRFYVNRAEEESFQHLKNKDALRIIMETLKNEQGISWIQFCSLLKAQIDTDDTTLSDYIHELLQLGLLEFDLGIPSHDAKWDSKLLRYLNALPDHAAEYFAPLTQALSKMQQYSKMYGDSTVTDRSLLQDKVCQQLKQVTLFFQSITLLAEVADGAWNPEEEPEKVILPLREENVFYEDVVSDVDLQIDTSELNTCINSFHNVLKSMKLFDMEIDEKLKIRDFFVSRYGIGAGIGILQFYQDYYREYKLNERLAQKEQNTEAAEALLSNSIKERRRQLQAWKDQFRQCMLGKQIQHDVLNITHVDFPNSNAVQSEEDTCAHGAFMQLFTGTNKDGQPQLMAVCNNYVHGYGKLLSRYLHLFDAKVWKDIVAWNQTLEKETECYAENSDGSHFNANIHPPLMTAEISHAQTQSNFTKERQLKLTDLEVRYNMSGDRLVLFHRPSKRNVYVFDLGFENSRSRSELFKVFTGFSKAKSFTCKPINTIVNQYVARKIPYKKDTINVSPRIVYEDRIVLKRKSWWIPVACLPFKEPLQTDWDYHHTVHQWYKRLELPDHVFVTVKPYRNAKPHEKEKTDDYKPQYIDFKNPLLVRLFGTLLLRADQAIVIEEMYPNPDQLVRIDGYPYVTEYLVQWDDQ